MRFVGAQQNAFVSGEFSPKLYHRSDLKAYQNGAKSLENMVVLRQGGATRRQGTVFVSSVYDVSTASRLVPFRRSLGVNFVLEFGHQYVRFYRNHALILAYQLVTPWLSTQIGDLRFAQSGDVLFITHPLYKPYKLSHFGDSNWTLNPIAQKAGPFLPQNVDKTIKISSTGQTGTVILTTVAPLFAVTDIGGIWKLRYEDISDIAKWAGETAYQVGDIVRSRGMFYECIETNEHSGVEAPEHTEGDEWDGTPTQGAAAGVLWRYLHSGYANVTITQYVSAVSVQAVVETGMTLPADIVQTGTYRWQRAAWSPGEGWPTSVGFFQERLCFGKLNALDMSTINDFENLSPTDKTGTVTFDAAVRFVISDPKVDAIRWFAPSLDVVLIGTDQSEHSFGAQTTSDPFGPDNVARLPQSAHGSAAFLQPERIDDAVIFANRGARRVYEMAAPESGIGKYASRELSVLADHLVRGVFEAAYCENPHGSYWAITDEGALVGMTYEKEQGVVAWHHHPLGGVDVFVESICAIPAPDGTYDELWLLVARTVNGATVRTVEYMSLPWEDCDGTVDACFTDCSVVYDYPNDPILMLPVNHLEGETVDILADGIDVGTQTVSGGFITLTTEAAKVVVGLPYRSRIETLTPDPGSEVGSSQGKRQRVVRAYVHFNRTAHCLLGPGPDGPLDVVTLMRGDQIMDEPTALFSGIREVPFPDGYSNEPTVVIEQNRPLPLEVYGIGWDMTVAAR